MKPETDMSRIEPPNDVPQRIKPVVVTKCQILVRDYLVYSEMAGSIFSWPCFLSYETPISFSYIYTVHVSDLDLIVLRLTKVRGMSTVL